MSTGLGAGTPGGLIPGGPGALEQTAAQLGAWGGALELAAEGLRRIDTSAGWSGKAADQFRQVFDNQPGKWLRAADAFRTAASALQRYAAVLGWAQGQAATALATWAAGPAHHLAAQEILQPARSEAASAADTAARAIAQARDLAPPAPGLLAEIGDDLSGALSSAWHGAVRLGEYGVDGLASMANAAVNDPTAALQSIGGLLLTGASSGGEALGVVLDATGLGSVAGVPLNALSAAGMATGATLAGSGIAKMIGDASGPDRVSMSQTSSTGGSGSGDDPNFDELKPAEQDTLIRLQQERPDLRAAPRGRFGDDPGCEYLDSEGQTYDQMGNPNTSRFWNSQHERFLQQIDKHLNKSVNYVVVDMTGFTSEQATEVGQYVDSLPSAQQARIIKIGF